MPEYRVVRPDADDDAPDRLVSCPGCGGVFREGQMHSIFGGETIVLRCRDCMNSFMREFARRMGGVFTARPEPARPAVYRGE